MRRQSGIQDHHQRRWPVVHRWQLGKFTVERTTRSCRPTTVFTKANVSQFSF